MQFTDGNLNSRTVTVRVYWTTLVHREPRRLCSNVFEVKRRQQSLFVLTYLPQTKKKLQKLKEIIKSKIKVLAAWNNHKGYGARQPVNISIK